MHSIIEQDAKHNSSKKQPVISDVLLNCT